MKNKRRRAARPARRTPSVLDRIQIDVAGIDCGASEHFVAVPPDRDPAPIQSFRTFTADLERLADWLVACRVTSVAMEATGVYWIPLFDILEARGLEVLLVNARHVTHVPGRKSDVEDCEWLRELHSVGLLRGSFRPAGPMLPLRAYLRHREVLVQTAGTHVRRMQKALVEMNLQLRRVVSDIVGVTGLKILRALVAGQHDPHVLALHRDPHCQASLAEITAALTGHYRAEHLFVLQQNLELFDMCQQQLRGCDTAIDAALQTLTAATMPPTAPLPRPRVTRRHGNEPHVDIRPALHHLTGVDLTHIDGIAPYGALKLVAEIGTDMNPVAHRTPRHRLAHPRPPEPGLRLAPAQRQDPTLGQSRRGRAPPCRHEPRPRPDRPRRLLSPVGRPRRQAQGYYHHRPQARHPRVSTLNGTLVYRDPGAHIYNARQRHRLLRRLRTHADTLGFALVDRETGELVEGTVS